ncbi:hypothetical protein RJ639_003315 [Escallonia herrerae]|uniref:Cytoplasmic tRNA 2-thiolation protein 2 n=1 Tax=Escallonia herrerae TaxID=1293975 RepID=A0AA88W2Y6_9ASTE|nr:hypothetical protein RJ639_003315 [Escallonia herrerae]
MACNTATCQSGGCYKDTDGEQQHPVTEQNPSTNGVVPRGDNNHHPSNLCLKCKTNKSIAATATAAAAGDGGRFCVDCFRGNLFGKFRVALQFVHEIQHKAQKNFDASASRDRSLPVFGVGAAFIDESAICPVSSNEFDEALEDMRLIVTNLAPPRKKFHIVPIESVYSSDCCNGRDRLKELLNAVSDVTGREDLLVHLRMLCLQKIALENGYTKLVFGSCTSRIACHILAATVKSTLFLMPKERRSACCRSNGRPLTCAKKGGFALSREVWESSERLIFDLRILDGCSRAFAKPAFSIAGGQRAAATQYSRSSTLRLLLHQPRGSVSEDLCFAETYPASFVYQRRAVWGNRRVGWYNLEKWPALGSSELGAVCMMMRFSDGNVGFQRFSREELALATVGHIKTPPAELQHRLDAFSAAAASTAPDPLEAEHDPSGSYCYAGKGRLGATMGGEGRGWTEESTGSPLAWFMPNESPALEEGKWLSAGTALPLVGMLTCHCGVKTSKRFGKFLGYHSNDSRKVMIPRGVIRRRERRFLAAVQSFDALEGSVALNREELEKQMELKAEASRFFLEDELMKTYSSPVGFQLSCSWSERFSGSCQSVVLEEVLAYFHFFFKHGYFERSLNATITCLIRQKYGAFDIRGFRPISLVGVEALFKVCFFGKEAIESHSNWRRFAESGKGRGYSLAADIQYVDARWEIPVVLPLRDCLMQELNVLCMLDSLKTVEVFNGSRVGINGLVTSFVKLLQEENPSRECTIARTAGKLTPFHFNKIPEADDCNDHLAIQRRQKKFNLKPNESLPPSHSVQFAVVLSTTLSRVEQIKDCLLSDSEDGT